MGRRKKIIQPEVVRTFEECYPEILSVINSRRHKWQLTAVPSIGWEDIMQILLRHIYIKWELYDQNKPLRSWLMVVVNNQMINILRNIYGNHKRPCLSCEFYEGNDLCRKYTTVSTDCDEFRTWTYGKKAKNEIQLPLPIENRQNEVSQIRSNNIDIAKSAEDLHEKMKGVLKPLEWTVYQGLYIQNKTEKEIAELLKFKTREVGRNPGYKQISNIRKAIIKKVKTVLDSGEIEIFEN